MSDPLTNLEIQDVLSSIRRLVSEDSRHRPQPEKGPAEERAEDRGDAGSDARSGAAAKSKLVLTDALRVPEPDEKADVLPKGEDTLRQSVAGDSVFDEAEHLPEADIALPGGDALLRDWETDSAAEASDAQSLEDTIAELEAAVAGIGGEFEPDGSEVAKGTKPDAALEDAFEDGFAVDEAAEEEIAELARPVTSGDLWSRPAPAAQELDEAMDDSTAVAEADDGTPKASVAASDDEPDDCVKADEAADMKAGDGAAAHAGPGDVTEETADLAANDDAELPEGSEGDGSEEPAGPIPAFFHGGGPRSSQPVAETGAVANGTVRRLTLTAADAVPGGPARWERDDAPEAEPLIDAGPDAGAGANDDGNGDGDDDDTVGLFRAGDEAVIDMEMLRDLVAEIIREELQGPLGERITRNVRMLVRREINRALESRHLD